MSEYQYYEFQAVDQPLIAKQIGELRRLSSRADITPRSFVNVYNYGDFRGDPDKLMDKYFDAFLYLANWGTHWLMLRLPKKLLPWKSVAAYSGGDCFSNRQRGDYVFLSFRSDEEDHGWAEGEGWLESLLPNRESLMCGDLRALYLGWLLAVQNEEVDEDVVEPDVPPGLAKLNKPLIQLADFLRIDADLIAAAAEHSTAKPSTSFSKSTVTNWLSTLPAKKKDAFLNSFIMGGDPNLVIKIQQQIVRSAKNIRSQKSKRKRTAGDLLERAQFICDARRSKKAKEQSCKMARRDQKVAKKKIKHLQSR